MSIVELERHRLAVGGLLAEGGEGRVHELAGRPGVLFKSYRNPVPLEPLRAVVAWRASLEAARPALGARLGTASAWPTAVVADAVTGRAAGVLMPRAPGRFWIRHRDGALRLASLSYLTADPSQRAAAYGLSLPPPMAPERVGLVYALARLIEAFEGASPSATHGDLSAKNVLWSLQRGPEVYVIDCDNAELYDGAAPVAASERRRAMTPNWEDAAVPPGADPGPFSDRYSMALIFLRIAGAAHFPIQARQRRGEPVAIDFELPPAARRLPGLERAAPLWRLAARGLSVAEPDARPPAAAWTAALEEVLADLGAAHVLRQVWAAQEGLALAQPSPPPAAAPHPPPDVRIRPVAQTPRTQAWRIVTDGGDGGEASGEPAGVVARRYARYALVWWWLAHRRMVRSLMSAGERGAGARRLVFLLLADFAMGCIALFLFAMVVSPFLGL